MEKDIRSKAVGGVTKLHGYILVLRGENNEDASTIPSPDCPSDYTIAMKIATCEGAGGWKAQAKLG